MPATTSRAAGDRQASPTTSLQPAPAHTQTGPPIRKHLQPGWGMQQHSSSSGTGLRRQPLRPTTGKKGRPLVPTANAHAGRGARRDTSVETLRPGQPGRGGDTLRSPPATATCPSTAQLCGGRRALAPGCMAPSAASAGRGHPGGCLKWLPPVSTPTTTKQHTQSNTRQHTHQHGGHPKGKRTGNPPAGLAGAPRDSTFGLRAPCTCQPRHHLRRQLSGVCPPAPDGLLPAATYQPLPAVCNHTFTTGHPASPAMCRTYHTGGTHQPPAARGNTPRSRRALAKPASSSGSGAQVLSAEAPPASNPAQLGRHPLSPPGATHHQQYPPRCMCSGTSGLGPLPTSRSPGAAPVESRWVEQLVQPLHRHGGGGRSGALASPNTPLRFQLLGRPALTHKAVASKEDAWPPALTPTFKRHQQHSHACSHPSKVWTLMHMGNTTQMQHSG